MPTKSRSDMIVAPVVGVDVCVEVNKRTGIRTSERSPLTMLTTAYPTIGKSSSITYVLGPKTQPIIIGDLEVMVPVFKPVEHHTVTRKAKPSLPTYFRGENRDYIFERTRCGAPGACADYLTYYSFRKLRGDGLLTDPYLTWQSVKSTAPAFAKTVFLTDSSLLGFKDAFNVLNFIAELKDVRRLPDLVRKWTRTSHDVSDKFLGVNFGLLPFASDIVSIAERAKKLGPSIDKWNDLAAKCKVINFHRVYPIALKGKNVGTEKEPIMENYKDYYHSGGTCGSPAGGGDTFIRVIVKQKFKAKVHIYVVPVNVPDDLIDDIKRDVWGVNKPLTALWNAIPFSFVVDWFTNLGDAISRFEQAEPNLRYKIVSSGVSLLTETEITFQFGTEKGSKNLGTVVSNYRSYYRAPIEPSSVLQPGVSYSSLRFQSLDQNQALLGSALMHQLLR